VAEFYASYLTSLDPLGGGFVREAPSMPERQGDASMDVLACFFHLPIKDASKALGMCTTRIKKICREHGLVRWPHRKVRGARSVGRSVATAVTIFFLYYACPPPGQEHGEQAGQVDEGGTREG